MNTWVSHALTHLRLPSWRGKGWLPSYRRWGVLALLVVLGAVVGCANGTYPLDFFYEMHYQQSYRSQEPPRLSPPAHAVPITGKEVPLESLSSDQISQMPNPFFRDGVREGVEQGKALFTVNCVICHGPRAAGDGEVLNIMREDYGYQVKLDPNLTGLGGMEDGKIFGIISDRSLVFPGIEGWVMPQFRMLMAPEERWVLVNYIRTLPPPLPACPELTGSELGKCLTQSHGCTVCHSLDGSAATGPTWKGLYGKQETLEDGSKVTVDDEYLHASIVDPDAKVVDGFPAGLMPDNFGDLISEEGIQAIIDYIETLK